jgi:transcriptional regulator with XRE-family HTH domain
MDRSYVGGVERGESSIAMLPLAAIAKELGVTLAQLMEDANL